MGKKKHTSHKKEVTITPTTLGLQKMVVNGVSTHPNLNQRLVYLYENTIRICLMENIQKIESRREWQAPFGILLTLGITFLTTDFKEWIFPKETWQAVFIMFGLISLFWLLRTFFVMSKKVTVDDIIDKLIPVEGEINEKK